MNRRATAAAALAVAPAALVVLALLAGGVVTALAQAVFPHDGPPSLRAFADALRAPGFVPSLVLTIAVSAVSTALTVLLGVLTALSLRRTRRFRRLVTSVYQMPLTVPHLVVAAAGLMVLSQSGILSRLLAAAGAIDSPAGFPELVYDRGGIGIILAYVWKQVPFVGLFALAVLQSVGEDYEAAARTLGATPGQAVRHVLVPLVMPALVPASVIIFAFVFGAFEVPLLMGARHPSMLSVLAYRLYTDVDLTLRTRSMALSFLIALFILGLLAAARTVLSVAGRSAGVDR